MTVDAGSDRPVDERITYRYRSLWRWWAPTVLLIATTSCGPLSDDVGDPPDSSTDPPEQPATLEEVNDYLTSEQVLGDVYFEEESPDVNPAAIKTLERQAALLREYPAAELVLEGHADERGTNEQNLALSDRRAQALVEYFTERGIHPDRLRTFTYGEERPDCTESDETCWQLNNRVRVALAAFGSIPLSEIKEFADRVVGEGMVWNVWASRNAVAVPSLKVGEIFKVTFDLSAYRYRDVLESSGAPDASTISTTKGAPELTTHMRDEVESTARPEEARIKIWAQPVLLGDGLAFVAGSGGAVPATIEARRLATPLPTDAKSAEDLGRAVSVLRDGNDWAPIVVDVETVAPGCAGIALSIWNGRPDKPLDYVVHHLPIGGTPCPQAEESKLPERLLRQFGSSVEDGRPQDAALHVFEMELQGEIQSVAVYVQRGSAGASHAFYSWLLGEPLSSYISHEDKLLLALRNSRQAEDGYDFAIVSDSLKQAIFSGRRSRDWDQADRARAAFETLLVEELEPRVYVRLVNERGQSVFLPLGLLESGDNTPLGSRALITQPLINEDFTAKPCVRELTFVLPEILEDVDASHLAPLTDAVHNLVTWEDFIHYAKQEERRTEGLVLTAHHRSGAILFSPELGSLSHRHFRHEFRSGGFVVLVACGAGELGVDQDRLGWVDQLVDLGVDAMVLSPFDVDGVFGAHFANHFALTVEEASLRPEPTSLRALFHKTIESLRADPEVRKLTDEAYEFIVAGDGEIAVCGLREEHQ